MEFTINNAEVIIASCSMFISLSATIFIAYQAGLMRRHNMLSVKPLLAFEIFGGRGEKVKSINLKLFNKDLGPAIIKSHKIYFDKKEIADSINIKESRAKVSQALVEGNHDFLSQEKSILPQNTAILPGEERILIGLSIPVLEGTKLREIEELIARFDTEIQYNSIYGKKYKLDTRKLNIENKI